VKAVVFCLKEPGGMEENYKNTSVIASC